MLTWPLVSHADLANGTGHMRLGILSQCIGSQSDTFSDEEVFEHSKWQSKTYSVLACDSHIVNESMISKNWTSASVSKNHPVTWFVCFYLAVRPPSQSNLSLSVRHHHKSPEPLLSAEESSILLAGELVGRVLESMTIINKVLGIKGPS